MKKITATVLSLVLIVTMISISFVASAVTVISPGQMINDFDSLNYGGNTENFWTVANFPTEIAIDSTIKNEGSASLMIKGNVGHSGVDNIDHLLRAIYNTPMDMSNIDGFTFDLCASSDFNNANATVELRFISGATGSTPDGFNFRLSIGQLTAGQWKTFTIDKSTPTYTQPGMNWSEINCILVCIRNPDNVTEPNMYFDNLKAMSRTITSPTRVTMINDFDSLNFGGSTENFWTVVNFPTEIAVDSSVKREGSASLKIKGNSGNSGIDSIDHLFRAIYNTPMNLSSAEIFSFDFCFASDFNSSNATIELRFVSGATGSTPDGFNYRVSIGQIKGGQWRTVFIDKSAPTYSAAGMDWANINCILFCIRNPDNVTEPDMYIDNLKVASTEPLESAMELNIMSFNIRCLNGGDTGVKAWDNRASAVCNYILNSNASIMCMQEVVRTQASHIASSVSSKYGAVYYERENTDNPEGLMTIYDKSQFDLVDRSVFWLSETPETVSLGWGAACYRICVVTVLQHKATGNLLNVYNVHLDHEAAAAQINGINLVLSRMADRKSGYNLVMGDFNVDNTNDAYKAIASKMNDCQVVAPNADLGCTFNGWSNATSGNSIDFIFVDKANTLPRNFNILRDTWGSGYNYSDHYAIRSNIAFGYTNEYIAQPVIAKINALPSTVTLANESEVTSARSAYNALTSAQRAYVTNLSKLTSAEQTVTDIKAANAVITQIDALPSTVTLANESAVTSARNAYEALTSAQRTYVTNLSKLTTAEQTITDIKAANSVMTKINAIPSPVTLISESVIVEARNAYNSLSDTQKSYVTNLSKLTAAETAITDMKTASAVVSKIEAIPSPVTLADESAIVTARNAYNGLTDAQKAYVPNLSKLTAAETAIADMKAASAVVTQIFNLPAIVTLADESAVAEARSAYNALSDAQKAQVPNLSKLTSAEKTISDIKTANEVVAKIDALVSSDSEAIAEARNAYDALSDSQKQYVTNLAKLEQLEAEFSVIYGDLNGDGTVSAVDALLVLQHAVNKITLKDRLLVAADVTSPYGEITSADALAILQYSVELIDSFEVSTK